MIDPDDGIPAWVVLRRSAPRVIDRRQICSFVSQCPQTTETVLVGEHSGYMAQLSINSSKLREMRDRHEQESRVLAHLVRVQSELKANELAYRKHKRARNANNSINANCLNS